MALGGFLSLLFLLLYKAPRFERGLFAPVVRPNLSLKC